MPLQEYVFDAEDGHTEIMPVRRDEQNVEGTRFHVTITDSTDHSLSFSNTDLDPAHTPTG